MPLLKIKAVTVRKGKNYFSFNFPICIINQYHNQNHSKAHPTESEKNH